MLFQFNDQNENRRIQLKKANFIIKLRKHTPTEKHVLLKKETDQDGLIENKEFNDLIKKTPVAVKDESELKRVGIEACFHKDKRGIDFYENGEILSTWRFDNGLKKVNSKL